LIAAAVFSRPRRSAPLLVVLPPPGPPSLRVEDAVAPSAARGLGIGTVESFPILTFSDRRRARLVSLETADLLEVLAFRPRRLAPSRTTREVMNP
jgi:hypothetical protein